MNIINIHYFRSTVFGIKPNVLEHPDSEFRYMSKKVFGWGFIGFIRYWIMTTTPWLAGLLRLQLNDQAVVDYFTNIINNTIKQRRTENVPRNDFVQMLMQLQEKGQIEIQNWDTSDNFLKSDTVTNSNAASYG